MTTLKQILAAKAAGDDSEYQLHMAYFTADKLDNAEKELARLSQEFDKAQETIEALTGLTLWQHSIKDPACFWMTGDKMRRESIDYPTRAAALRALLDDKIEWR